MELVSDELFTSSSLGYCTTWRHVPCFKWRHNLLEDARVEREGYRVISLADFCREQRIEDKPSIKVGDRFVITHDCESKWGKKLPKGTKVTIDRDYGDGDYMTKDDQSEYWCLPAPVLLANSVREGEETLRPEDLKPGDWVEVVEEFLDFYGCDRTFKSGERLKVARIDPGFFYRMAIEVDGRYFVLRNENITKLRKCPPPSPRKEPEADWRSIRLGDWLEATDAVEVLWSSEVIPKGTYCEVICREPDGYSADLPIRVKWCDSQTTWVRVANVPKFCKVERPTLKTASGVVEEARQCCQGQDYCTADPKQDGGYILPTYGDIGRAFQERIERDLACAMNPTYEIPAGDLKAGEVVRFSFNVTPGGKVEFKERNCPESGEAQPSLFLSQETDPSFISLPINRMPEFKTGQIVEVTETFHQSGETFTRGECYEVSDYPFPSCAFVSLDVSRREGNWGDCQPTTKYKRSWCIDHDHRSNIRLTTSPFPMSCCNSIIKKAKWAFLSKLERNYVSLGLKNEDGTLTEDGRNLLLEKLFEAHGKELMDPVVKKLSKKSKDDDDSEED